MAIVEVQRVDAVEELELDSASAQRLVQRGDDDVPHPGRHLPEERALVLEQGDPGEQQGHPGGQCRSLAVAVLVSEDHVVQPANEGKVHDVGMGAVAENPRAEVLVVDGAEAAWISDQIVGDYSAYSRRLQRQEQPETPVIGPVLVVERLADRVEGSAQRSRPELPREQVVWPMSPACRHDTPPHHLKPLRGRVGGVGSTVRLSGPRRPTRPASRRS